jgi:hypothetical protein
MSCVIRSYGICLLFISSRLRVLIGSLRRLRILAVRPGMSTVEHPLQVFRFADGSLLSAQRGITVEKDEQFHLVVYNHLSVRGHQISSELRRV